MRECTKDCDELQLLMKQQKDMIQSMGEIITKLDSSQLKVEQNAFDVINSSDTSLKLVKDGIVSVDALFDKIKVLNDITKNTSIAVHEMQNLSNMIAGFASIIGGISNKTNMLALNASIEAAKAEEQAIGFSKIVSEIKNLAEQSSESSNDIAETIQAIQVFVSQTIEVMNRMYEVVGEQNAMVSDVKEVFHNILEAAYTSSDVAHNVENEVAFQRDITDNAKYTLDAIYDMAVATGCCCDDTKDNES